MTPEDTLKICRYIKARCPGQPIDEFTVDAWHEDLGEYPFAQVRLAAQRMTAGKVFVSLCELLAGVRQIRNDNVTRARGRGELTVPSGLSDTEERDWIRSATKAAADRAPEDRPVDELPPSVPPANHWGTWDHLGVPRAPTSNGEAKAVEPRVEELRALIRDSNKIPTT